MGLCQNAPQLQHWPQRIYNTCWWTITQIYHHQFIPSGGIFPSWCMLPGMWAVYGEQDTAGEVSAVKAVGTFQLSQSTLPFLVISQNLWEMSLLWPLSYRWNGCSKGKSFLRHRSPNQARSSVRCEWSGPLSGAHWMGRWRLHLLSWYSIVFCSPFQKPGEEKRLRPSYRGKS